MEEESEDEDEDSGPQPANGASIVQEAPHHVLSISNLPSETTSDMLTVLFQQSVYILLLVAHSLVANSHSMTDSQDTLQFATSLSAAQLMLFMKIGAWLQTPRKLLTASKSPLTLSSPSNSRTHQSLRRTSTYGSPEQKRFSLGSARDIEAQCKSLKIFNDVYTVHPTLAMCRRLRDPCLHCHLTPRRLTMGYSVLVSVEDVSVRYPLFL